MKEKNLTAWAIVDTQVNEVLFTVPTRDLARDELRDAKRLFGKHHKIAKMTVEKFVR